MMIPKIIHYCWVSDDPYPGMIQRCVDSWKKVLPEYEIRRWTMEKVWYELEADGCIDGKTLVKDLYEQWLREAFEAKKYAFVADWVRFYALSKYGGIYLDSDVEVFRNFDDLLDLPYFLGFENGSCLEAAVIGARSGCGWVETCLVYYKHRRFVMADNSEMQKYIDRGEYISEPGYSVRPAPCIVAERLYRDYRVVAIKSKVGFVNDGGTVCVFPKHYFSFSNTAHGSENTERYCVHHGVGSWKPKRVQRNLKIWAAMESVLGHRMTGIIVKALKRMIGKRRNHE